MTILNFQSWKNTPQGKAIEDFAWFTLYTGATAAVTAAGVYVSGHQADLTSVFGVIGFTLLVSGVKAASYYLDQRKKSE